MNEQTIHDIASSVLAVTLGNIANLLRQHRCCLCAGHNDHDFCDPPDLAGILQEVADEL